MKNKFFFIIIFLLISCNIFSQILIGKTYKQISKILYPLEIIASDTFYSAKFDNGDRYLLYYFGNKTDICYMYAIVTEDDYYNVYKEDFDNKYKPIAISEWIDTDGMIIDIIDLKDKKICVRYYYPENFINRKK